jgi:competence protein ComEC
MLPLGMYWFQRASALGIIANLFAIPAVSIIIVPLVLLGVVLVSLDGAGLASALLLPAAWLAQGLFRALSWLATQGAALQWTTAAIPFAVALLLGFAGLCILGPAGWKGRLLAPLLALGALSLTGLRPAPGELRLDLLDVGQGLAAMVTTRDSLLLYDSGPGQPGQWDLVDSVILPAIRANGHTAPSRIVIGHGDLDHAGGLGTLQTRFPQAPVWLNASSGRTGTRSCTTQLKWTDAVAGYTVWHPSSHLPYLGNLSSCVLSIESPDHAELLPGDIDRVVERRLVAEGLDPHDVLVAPHHGSRTSSGPDFLAAVRPRWVLIPAGAGNRFGFPHPEVRQRYESMGMFSASVSDCGALQLRLGPGRTAVLRSARTQRAALWRWPAADSCP